MKHSLRFINRLPFLFLLLLFISCQKTLKLDESASSSHSQMIAWRNQIQNLLAGPVSTRLDSLIARVDESKSHILKLTNTTELFLKALSTNSTNSTSFLCFTKKGSSFKSVGLVEVNSQQGDIIKEFFYNGSLPSGNVITIKNFRGDVLNRLQHEQSGGVSLSSAFYVKRSDKPANRLNTANALYNASGSSGYFIDWYLQTILNGVVIDEDYAYSEWVSTADPSDFMNLGWENPAQYASDGSGDADDGALSCETFSYRPMTGAAYEAGVTGLQFVMDILGGGALTFDFRDIYVQFPSNTADNRNFTPGQAAAITARAMNKAGLTMSGIYLGVPQQVAETISASDLDKQFITLVNAYINIEINAGATVTFTKKGANTVTNSAVWNSGFSRIVNGLTGKNCK
jgi:hypothetical protein